MYFNKVKNLTILNNWHGAIDKPTLFVFIEI